MDRHFRSAPLEANLPVVLALLNLWYTDFFGAQSRAVIPYDQHLEYLAAYLQQLEMESNGKGVTLSGSALDYPSAPVVWGAPGTNGQHAFFQLLHQGTLLIPVDFLVAWHGHHSPEEQHELLVANCIAQSQALMLGRNAAEVGAEMRARGVPETEVERLVSHRVCPGNRPSNILCYERLTPETLGVSSPSTSTRPSPKAWSSASIPSISGGSSSAKRWRARSRRVSAEKYRPRTQTPRRGRSSNAIVVGPATSPSRPPPGNEPAPSGAVYSNDAVSL
jgi:hypothetical protein